MASLPRHSEHSEILPFCEIEETALGFSLDKSQKIYGRNLKVRSRFPLSFLLLLILEFSSFLNEFQLPLRTISGVLLLIFLVFSVLQGKRS
jgi:hypothetical protein